MKNKIILTIIICFFQISFVNASIFEGIDKAPEGAHEGQMVIGFFGSIGMPFGSLINTEKDFVDGDRYTFSENGVIKEFLTTHLAYDFGLFFEYMPIDYVGIKSKLKKVYIVQRTLFGSNYQNWNESLYSSYSFLLGPSIHFTNRKPWDVSLTPLVGYSIAKYRPTPIAQKLMDSYSGVSKKNVNGIIYGVELNYARYFSSGLFLSIGFDWNKYPISLSPEIKLTNPYTHKDIDISSGDIQSINLDLSIGYAFDH